jgi:hypothetical protein
LGQISDKPRGRSIFERDELALVIAELRATNNHRQESAIFVTAASHPPSQRVAIPLTCRVRFFLGLEASACVGRGALAVQSLFPEAPLGSSFATN